MAVSREPWFKSFVSNLKEFLTERPAKLKPGADAPFLVEKFHSDVSGNFRAMMRPLPAGARTVDSDMLVSWAPSFGSFWDNFRSAFAKGVPKGVDVPDIWTKDEDYPRSQALAVALHVVLVVIIAIPFLPEIMGPRAETKPTVSVVPIDDVSPFIPKLPAGAKKAGGGGGGGEHNPIPASKGKLPKASYTQLAPPSVHPPLTAKLQVTPTIVAVPDIKIPSPNMPNYGDPMAKLVTDSNGPGSGSGIGSGNGTGVGSGNGAGVGPGEGWNTGGGPPMAGTGGYGQPGCVYCPQPPFSDEAVKAKYQGTVTLSIVVQPDGRATDIHVVRGVGLGLDEKAAETLKTWRFTPAIGPNGRPSAVRMIVEVAFHLY
jgi:periplasmic protein TonB